MIRFVPWSEVGTITVEPGDTVVEVGAFELAEGADTLWVRMTNTGTPGPWPWSYGILSFKTEEGQPLGSIKAYNSFDGEVFRLGVGLAPSVRSGVLTFEPRGFNMAWIKQGNPWSLKFEAQSGGGTVSSGYWNRDPENGVISPKVRGDNLDMLPGWIKASNLILTDGQSPDRDVPGFQQGTFDADSLYGTVTGTSTFVRIGQLVFVSGVATDFTDFSTNHAVALTNFPYPIVARALQGAVLGKYVTPPVTATFVSAADDTIRFYGTGTGDYPILKYTGLTSAASTVYYSAAYLTSDTTWQPLNGSVGRSFTPADLLLPEQR